MTTGSSADPERLERRLDEEAEPVGDDLDRDAGRLRAPDERHEAGVVRLRGGRREQVGRVGVDQRHLQAISRREPISPASYAAASASQTPGTCSAMTVSDTSVSAIVPS